MFRARITRGEDNVLAGFPSTEACWKFLADTRKGEADLFETAIDPETSEKYDRIYKCLGRLGANEGPFVCKDGISHDPSKEGSIFDSGHAISYVVEKAQV